MSYIKATIKKSSARDEYVLTTIFVTPGVYGEQVTQATGYSRERDAVRGLKRYAKSNGVTDVTLYTLDGSVKVTV